MKAYFRYFGILSVLFLGIFFAQRHLFLAFGHEALHGISLHEILESHWRALPMDLSTIGYVLLVVSLLSLPLLFKELPWLRRAARIFLVAFIICSALVNVVDIGLFDARGMLIDRKALSYLRYPKDVIGATSAGRLALLLLVATVQSMLFIYLLERIDHRRPYLSGRKGIRIVVAVLIPVLCIIALRGGPQSDPINQSWGWFSKRPVLNLAAMNGMLNLMEIAVGPDQLTAAQIPTFRKRGTIGNSRCSFDIPDSTSEMVFEANS